MSRERCFRRSSSVGFCCRAAAGEVVANTFSAGFHLIVHCGWPLAAGSKGRLIRYWHFSAACSVGECPRSLDRPAVAGVQALDCVCGAAHGADLQGRSNSAFITFVMVEFVVKPDGSKRRVLGVVASMSEPGPVDLLRLAEDLYRLRIMGGPAHLLNSYLWTGADGVTLVDTGWPGSELAIAKALQSLDRSPADVDRVVLTHFHDDHAGAAAAIAQWSDRIKVCVGEPDAAYVDGTSTGPLPTLTAAEQAIHPPSPRPPQAAPCRVDRRLRDGDVLPFAGGCQVIGTPGHTPGSVALYLPSIGTLLTGDTIAEVDGTVILGVFNLDREQVLMARDRLAATGAEIAGYGHGEASFGQAADRIRRAPDPFA